MPEERKFKINDLVEVTKWTKDKDRRNWIITGFASNGAEAVLCQIPTGTQAIIMLTDLKLQTHKKERR